MTSQTHPRTGAPLLSAIVVSYNTREMTLECLRVLSDELKGINAEIWVVDNASNDGSAPAIRAAFPEVQLLENADNAGFGAANNAAMERASGAYFLLLNSDAFPRPGAISSLLEQMDAHPRAGAIGPKLLNRDGSLQRSCWRFPSPSQSWLENLGVSALLRGRTRWGNYYHWAHDTEREVDFVIGACLLVKREVWEKIGGFDPAFWMYAEETDWQKRMKAAGHEIWFSPRAEVEHWGGASGGTVAPRTRDAFFGSQEIYILKHHGASGLRRFRAANKVGNTFRIVLWALFFLVRPQKRAQAREKMQFFRYLLRRRSGAGLQ
ncbi:MAG TPA: glycosyltransferase family 2 protein [Abditibacterium sp.]